MGHDVGRRYSVVRYDVEDALIRGYVVPREARSISVSLDRVAVPFEELRTRSPGRPPKGAPNLDRRTSFHVGDDAAPLKLDEAGMHVGICARGMARTRAIHGGPAVRGSAHA